MQLMDFLFGKKKPSASMAKERLQLIIAHERGGGGSALLKCEQLQRELTEVIARHVGIDTENVKVHFDKTQNFEVIEVKIEVPQREI